MVRWPIVLIIILLLIPSAKAIVWDELEPYGYVGLLTMIPVQESPTPPEPVECKCNGTGYVIFDGSSKVKCPCDNCQCQKPQGQAIGSVAIVTERLPRVILVTDVKICPPCRFVDKEIVQKLNTEPYTSQGWSSGDSPMDKLQVVDFNDKATLNEVLSKEQLKGISVNAIPTFIYIDAEKAEKRVGSMDIYDFIAFATMGDKRATYKGNNSPSVPLKGVEWQTKHELIYEIRINHKHDGLLEGLTARELKFLHDDLHANNPGEIVWE